MSHYDVAVIGGGIVGLATAMALLERRGRSVVVLEAEDCLAAHQSGHNSGVIHSGLYYAPGSLKARLCVEGRDALYGFCESHDVACERCGKIVVAVDETELPALQQLHRRGAANGLRGLRLLTPDEVREHEPHVACRAGLFVAETGVVDFSHVSQAYASVIVSAGGEIRTRARVVGVRHDGSRIVLQTTAGDVGCRMLVACAGLQADRLARACGLDPGVQIVPFRGEYHELRPERADLVRHLIYPVPDPRFPFLGVHFTRDVHGRVAAGPSALPAFKREGYGRWSFSLRDALEMAAFAGAWRLGKKYAATAWAEVRRSVDRRALCAALRRMVPQLQGYDLRFAGTGVRAQAVTADGSLVDDFRFVAGERMLHVINAPSPAATASISIGRTIARMVRGQLG